NKDIEKHSPNLQEGMVSIVLSWVVAILFGTVPFLLISNLTFSQAIFESTSGWTTTGLSVVDVTTAPPIILLYRSIIQLVGGAGFAIIVLSSITGPVGSGLSEAEGRDDKLAPNVRHSAGLVLRIYISYVIFGIVAYALAGMPVFDAVNHAFAAVSTGGFSTRPESIGYYDSIAIEAVTFVLMLLGTLNFLTAWLVVRGKWRDVLRNGEIRLFAVLLPIAATLIFASLVGQLYTNAGETMRVALFETFSALSTTGFSITSYGAWTPSAIMVMIIIMTIGGGSGSTSGGIKQFRIYILLNALYWEIRKAFLPENAVNRASIWRGSERVPLTDKQVRRTALYLFFYVSLFFVLTLGILFHGNYTVAQALFES
ncbi:MAG: potassium transporter TrkG, partial [Chloroflexota bacterium]